MTREIGNAASNVSVWLGTNFGSGVFFFVLDLMLVALLLPAILNRRERRRWRELARTLLYEALTRIEIIAGGANGLYGALYPALNDLRQSQPDAPPDAQTLSQVRRVSAGARQAIDEYTALFGLAGASLQVFPEHSSALLALVRSLLESGKQLGAMEAAPDWHSLWAAFVQLKHEVEENQSKYRATIQEALNGRYLRST